MERLIITVAPTGSLPRKEQNPHVPITPSEIAECALRCEDAGASILHVHVRDQDQASSDNPALFGEVVDLLAGRSELIIQISTGGRAGSTLESRKFRLVVPCEMASLTTGSVNFPRSAYVNPPELVEGLAREMQERGVKPEMEIFDVSMITNAIALRDMGLAQAPLHFDFVLGLKGAQPALLSHLAHLANLIPDGSTWTVAGVGPAQLSMGIHAVLMGGHVRVGLEDNLYYRKGELASNEMLVERVARLSRELGREVATPDQARALLNLSLRKRT